MHNGLLALTSLDADQLAQLEELEQAVVDADKIRIKLEMPTLRSRAVSTPHDYLWYDDNGKIVGFVGRYQFQPGVVELTGMVHPDHRRQGIFSKLLDSAQAQTRSEGDDQMLLVADRESDAAAAFADEREAAYHLSEFLMVRDPAEPRGPVIGAAPGVAVRPAQFADAQFVGECMHAAFGDLDSVPTIPDPASLIDPERPTFVILQDEAQVGCVMVRLDEDGQAFIYGLSVIPRMRGRGIGRAALGQLIALLRNEGYEHLALEVAAANERALQLYTGCGFTTTSVMDYYILS